MIQPARPPDNLKITRRQAEEYLSILYGRCADDHGHVVVVDRSKCRPVEIYRPGEIDLAADTIAHSPSCFLKVNPMDCGKMARRRMARQKAEGRICWVVGSAAEVKTIISFHLDVDAGKSSKYASRAEVLDALGQMPHSPSLIVDSNGPDGGFHVYWILREPHRITDDDDREQIKLFANRWQGRLSELLPPGALDSTANIDRLLRPAGSLRDSGNVVSIFHHDAAARYSIEDLSLPATEAEVRQAVREQVKLVVREYMGPRSTDQPVTDYIDGTGLSVADLLTEAGYTQLRGDEWRRPGAANPGRSLKTSTLLDRPGINVFSGGDPLFPCLQSDGSVGRFYSIDQMFVTIRHGGDWKAAASWCRQEIERQAPKVTFSGSLASLQGVGR